MSYANNLIKNTTVYAVGNFGSKLLSFLLIPIFSFFIVKESLGEYDLLLSVLAFLVPVATLQISDSLYRWLLESESDQDVKGIISTGFFAFIGLVCFVTILILLVDFFVDVPYKNHFILLFISSSFFPILQQILRGLKENLLYATAGVLNSFLIVLFNVIFLYSLGATVESILLASSLAYVITISYIMVKVKFFKKLKLESFSKKLFFEMIHYSIPLIPNTIGWWLISIANKFIILYFLDMESNGLFAVSARFPSIIAIINGVFMLSWQDHIISEKGSDENTKFSEKLFQGFMKFELTLVLLLIPFSKIIIDLSVDESYIDSWRYMPLLFIASAFSAFSGYFGAIYLKNKKTKSLFMTTIVGGILNVLVSIVFIRLIGLQGAAIGTLSGFFSLFVIRYYATKKELPISLNVKVIAFLSLLSLIYVFIILQDNYIYTLGLVLLSVCLFVFYNRQLLNQIFKIVQLKIKNNK